MGNMPNKWGGRGLALLAGFVAALAGWAGGDWIGQRLAYGFSFDWYVHPPQGGYASREVLTALSLTASLLCLAGLLLAVGLTAPLTRGLARRMRYAAPRVGDATGLDLHAARVALLASGGTALLVPLVAYVVLSMGLLPGGSGRVIDRISPDGYGLLMAAAGAAGALVGTTVGAWTTFTGILEGRIVENARRNVLSTISLFGMRNAKTTVAAVILLTLVAGYHAQGINTNADVADVMPRGDPNTDAAHNLTSKFKSSFTQQVTFQLHVLNMSNVTQRALYERENERTLPDRVTEERPGNITDELYVRAIDELMAYVLTEYPFKATTSSADIFRLVNWTIAGGETAQNREGEKAFRLPGDVVPVAREDELRYEVVERGALDVESLYNAVDALSSPTWQQTSALVSVDPNDAISTKEIGQRALEVRDEWIGMVERGETRYRVFGPDNPPMFSVDLPIANAHASELTGHDFRTLLPIIGVFIALTLFIAFRNLASVAVTFSMLAIAVTWTFGLMAYMGIPLNTLNLAVVPLIMGVGIDYGIHMMNEYTEYRAQGKSPAEAWTEAGTGSALALFVGMLTTAAGLLIMVVSPSLLVAQLGLLAVCALVSCYLLSVLFVPAALSVLGDRKQRRRLQYTPSRIMPGLATAVSRARWFVLAVLLVMAGAAYSSASGIHREAFGDPPRNWLPDDPLRQEHERAINGFYDTDLDDIKANVLIFEGDMTDPAVHRYIAAVTSTLKANSLTGSWIDRENGNRSVQSRVIGDTLRDLPFIVNTYLTVRDGVPGAGQFIGMNALGPKLDQLNVADPTGQTETYPQTQEEIREVLEQMFRSPLRRFGNIFIDHPSFDMGVTIFSVRAGSYADAEMVWREVHAALAANADVKPAGLTVSFFGNTAINYLFVAKQVPWLGYMSVATVLLVTAIVFAFTRSLRATALVAACNVLTSTFWIGVLPAFGIGLAISLTLPLIFIFAMGSDYALHLAMRCRKSRDTYSTFESVGKGVMYSFLTTFGAFLVFTFVSDLAGRRSMIATSIAIGAVFLTTLLAVPIFYPVRRGQGKEESGSRTVPLVESRPVATPPVSSRTGTARTPVTRASRDGSPPDAEPAG